MFWDLLGSLNPLLIYIGKKFMVETHTSGVDPGFLERELICIKGWGFALLILSQCS